MDRNHAEDADLKGVVRMLNAEKFKEEILSINDVFGVYKGEPVCCHDLLCKNCKFHDIKSIACGFNRINWMLSEYEPLKIEPEVYNLKCDDRVEVSNDGIHWKKQHLKFAEGNVAVAWSFGKTSFTKNTNEDVGVWKYARIPREE